jgi:hypothetical protein
VDQVLKAELAVLPDAVVIPLGRTVATILRREVDQGGLQAGNCLFEFPHPSGGNGHRVRLFTQHRKDLVAQVAAWGH